jgi:hypothetical protein
MKIYITFKEDDPLNFKHIKVFWTWKYVKIFLKNNLDFDWKKDDFFLDKDDPLRKTIENYKFIKKGERYDRFIH